MERGSNKVGCGRPFVYHRKKGGAKICYAVVEGGDCKDVKRMEEGEG